MGVWSRSDKLGLLDTACNNVGVRPLNGHRNSKQWGMCAGEGRLPAQPVRQWGRTTPASLARPCPVSPRAPQGCQAHNRR